MRVLVDTDVILDYLLVREPFFAEAEKIWEAQLNGSIEGYVAAITPLNVFYIAHKLKGNQTAREIVNEILDNWTVCRLDQITLKIATTINITDYEDAVQHTTAQQMRIGYIVTRNLDDYKNATVTVLSPAKFLQLLAPSE